MIDGSITVAGFLALNQAWESYKIGQAAASLCGIHYAVLRIPHVHR